MSTQDVILDFQCRHAQLEAHRVLDTQLQVSLLVSDLAERLYHARTVYLGGGCLLWHELTPMQQACFRAELEELVKGVK